MGFGRFRKSYWLLFVAVVFGLAQVVLAQDIPGNNSNWTASSQQQDPRGVVNPTRSRESHIEADGRVIDKKSVEALGPDGQYVPYLDTEQESLRINSTTVRTIQRTFGRGSDGQRMLLRERQEESRTLPDGEQKVVREISNPDANGTMQVVQREVQDSRQAGPGVREVKTTVLTPDVNGGFTPTVQIEESQKQSNDGTVEFKKSTLLSDGAGHWQLGEVREGSQRGNDQGQSKEERLLRPDSNGNLAIVERTVSKQTESGSGEKRDTVETYSTNVPGAAGNDDLQLVRRATTVRRNGAAGEQATTQQIERRNPGAPHDGLNVTDATIDIVRPGGNGVAEQQNTILTRDSAGRLSGVWIDLGKTDNPSAAIQVDTRISAKPH